MYLTDTTNRLLVAALPFALTLSACGGTAPGADDVQAEPDPSELTMAVKPAVKPEVKPAAKPEVKPAAKPAVALQFARSRTSPAEFTTEFLVASDGSIEIASDLSKLAHGSHSLAQQVLAPDGSVFSSCVATFEGRDDGLVEGDCDAAGNRLHGQGPDYRLWNTVVLAKKWGVWTVKSFLDGASEPSATATFSLGGVWAEIHFATSRTSPAFGAAFPLASTSQIEIATDLHGFAAGAHAMRMDLLDANGLLFAAVRDSFDPADPTTCDEVVDGACRIWWTLQIAGTPIEFYQMAGTWKVQETFDSAPSALAAASFEIVR